MKESYVDITSRIAEEPTWWDENGTPRYGDFTPDRCPNIYSNTVALLRITCQDCGQEFRVEMHEALWSEFNPLKLHYGDPPIHGCVGDTMNSVPREVLECWHRTIFVGWKRQKKYEGKIDCGWA